uniref:Transposase n=1 Tax=Candidatus Kentrum sp. TC TaxID=2126339 RepID=A0A451A212_9GAMM|nr:MAG: Transposase [Candidatus Kentron sp. TC]
MVREELFPVVLENPLESEMAFVDGFHNGLNSTSIPDSATNYYCPEGGSCSTLLEAVRENLPEAVLVFDHFHIIKLYNEKLPNPHRKIARETDVLEK